MNNQKMYTVSSEPPRNIEYELIQSGKIRSDNAPMGDFLSRLWGNFGKPQRILFEGYIYNINDKGTGLDFLVSYGASGPAYYAENLNIERLKPAVLAFEKFLDTSENVDCEIEVETDFGFYLCGSKNGIPYEKEKENAKKKDLFKSNLSGTQYYDNLIFNLKIIIENNKSEHYLALKNIDIEECITYLNAYITAILRSKTVDEGFFAVKMTVIALNNLNRRCENTLIVEEVGAKIIEIINSASHQMGYSASNKDITKEWREW